MSQAANIVDALRELRPTIEARAAEIEELGTIPDDLYAELVATGYLRMAVPAEFGGAECSLPEMNAIITEAARADGSVGWLAMIASHVPILLSRLPAATFASFFADGPDLRARVALAPKGVAVAVEGGYEVSGQFPFASGGPGPSFVGGGCIVMENGAPSLSDAGRPQIIMAVFRAEDVEFLDTWHVVGLKGTNSCDFAAHEVFVPRERTADLFFGKSSLEGPLGRLSFRAAVTPGHVAVAAGIARGLARRVGDARDDQAWRHESHRRVGCRPPVPVGASGSSACTSRSPRRSSSARRRRSGTPRSRARRETRWRG